MPTRAWAGGGSVAVADWRDGLAADNAVHFSALPIVMFVVLF
jgi:hypothetical protein